MQPPEDSSPPTSPPPQVEEPGAPSAGASGQPPPAASAVMRSDLVESDAAELVRLRRERDELSRARRDLETRVSEVEDENRRLKTLPPTVPPRAAEKQKRSFLHGATFFDLGGAD